MCSTLSSVPTRLLLLALAGAAALGLAACGGSGSTSLTTSSNTSASAQVLTAVHDAPLTGVIEADITVANAAMTTATGSVTLFTAPRKVEVTGLGLLDEPLSLESLAPGTYTGISFTVTAAHVTYIDPTTQQPVSADAVVNNGAVSLTFAQPITITTSDATELRLDVNLAQSFDLTGSTVTFTPVITVAPAPVDKESEADKDVEVTGTVTAVTATSFTVKQFDSGASLTLNVNSSTSFQNGASLAALQVGSVVHAEGQVQQDGSLLALTVEMTNGGMSEDGQSQDSGNGIVVSTTKDSSGNLTSFQWVATEEMDASTMGQPVTVTVSSSTNYVTGDDESSLSGLPAFNASQIFAGQDVLVSGAWSGSGSSQQLAASEIMLGQVNALGTLAAPPAGTLPNLTFTLNLDATSPLDSLAGMTTLNASTSAATQLCNEDNGGDLSLLTSLATGTELEARGVLVSSNGQITLQVLRVGPATDAQSSGD